MPDTEIHRYELLGERRSRDRRAVAHPAPPAERDRRGTDRRSGRSLADSWSVRRIFPIAEGTATASVKTRCRVQRWSLAVADGLMAVLAVSVVSLAVAGWSPSVLTVLGAAAAAVVGARALGLYDKDDLVLRRSTLDEAPRLAEIGVIVGLASWFIQGPEVARWTLVALWVASTLALVAGRATARALERALMPAERCIVIGDATVAAQIRAKVDGGRANAEVVDVVPLYARQTAEDIGGVEGLRSLVRRADAHRVILAPVSTDAADTLELVRVAKLAGVRVSVLPRLFEVVGSAVEFETVDGMTMLGVRRFGLSGSARFFKRTFDVVGATAALVLLAPVLAVIAMLIRLDSRGPVFFRQTRVGRDGQHFCIYKFRTMVADAERRKNSLRHLNEAARGFFKIAADPRITRVGRVLRRTSLDELPQLLNVVRGDMSLVGPRPLIVDEDERILGLDRQRLHLTPGMTGPWQILGSSRVPMEEMVGLDYLYVSSWSLWTDVKLLVRTARHVLERGGR